MELDPKPSDVVVVLTCILVLLDGPANLLVFASYTSNKTMDGLWLTFTNQCEPDTGSFGTSPEDVIILRSLKQEVLMCVNNSAAVAILFSFSREIMCFLAPLLSALPFLIFANIMISSMKKNFGTCSFSDQLIVFLKPSIIKTQKCGP